MKVALISGGNRGIGFETGRGLAQLGYHVLLGTRDIVQGNEAAQRLRDAGLLADAIRLDVDDAVSHADAAASIEERFGHLDALVNNAAVIHDRDVKPSEVTPEAIRKTFETNFVMLVALTQRMLPLLRKSEAGRIVNLTSYRASLSANANANGPFTDPQTLAYSASKAAVNMFTAQLAQELRPFGIKVNSADPGWVKTEMGGAGATMEVEDGAKTSVRLASLPEDGPTGGFFHESRTIPW